MNAIRTGVRYPHDTFRSNSSCGPMPFAEIAPGNNDRHFLFDSALFPALFSVGFPGAGHADRAVKYFHTRRTDTPPSAGVSAYNFSQQ